MKTIMNASLGGLLILLATGIAGAQQATGGYKTSGFLAGVDVGPLIAAVLALALIAQGGKKRLRM
jgi:hypothetical protein